MQVTATSAPDLFAVSKSATGLSSTFEISSEDAQAPATMSNAGFNLSDMLSSDAVSAVLSAQNDGKLVWKDPGRTITNQESLAWNAVVSQNITPQEAVQFKFTDSDKAFIHQPTGYNLVTFLRPSTDR